VSDIRSFDARRYLELMSAINDRFSRALERLKCVEGPDSGHLAAEEFALQVRMICESIVASSFVFNRRVYAQVIGKVTSPSEPDKLVRELLTLNKAFMPTVVVPCRNANGSIDVSAELPDQIEARFLVSIHGKCGNFLHLKSATEAPDRLKTFGRDFHRFLEWMNKYLAGHALGFLSSPEMYVFDGAAAVSDGPSLLRLNSEKSHLLFTLVPAGIEKARPGPRPRK
jgi:hypothetical protein